MAMAPAPPAEAAAARCTLRPALVPASLADLHGPTSGLAELPVQLSWSFTPGHQFDLAVRDDVIDMYSAVFNAARTVDDITAHVDAALLAWTWADLSVERAKRRAMEAAFPALAARPAAAA